MQLCILNLLCSIVQHWGCEDTNLKHRTSNISLLFAKGHLTIQSVLRTDSIHCYYYLQALKYIGILFSASSNLLSFTWFFLVFCLEKGNNNSCKILRERGKFPEINVLLHNNLGFCQTFTQNDSNAIEKNFTASASNLFNTFQLAERRCILILQYTKKLEK